MTRRQSRSGLCLALLALAIQFAFGAVGGALPGEARSVASAAPVAAGKDLAIWAALLPGAGILCHSDADAPSSPPGTPGQRHSHGDCAICPLCAAIAQHMATPTAAPIVPAPSVLAVRLAAPPPPATAPPILRLASARPRAPPALT